MKGPSKGLLDEGFYTYKKNAGQKRGKQLCWVKGCREYAKPDRCLCSKHYMRRWRSNNKRTSDYCLLQNSAAKRNLDFDLTPDYWHGLTDAFDFYKQEDPDLVLTIDRVNPVKGYVMGNLRVVSLSLNSLKGSRERYLPEHVQAILERKRQQAQKDNKRYLDLDESPFAGEAEYLEPEEAGPEILDPECPF